MVPDVKQLIGCGALLLGLWGCASANVPESKPSPLPKPVAVLPKAPPAAPPVNPAPRLVKGNTYTCLLQTNGHFSCWGRVDDASSSSPVLVDQRRAKSVVFYESSLLVMDADGQVYEGSAGAPYHKPIAFTLRPDLAAISALSCDGSNCCGIEKGNVLCWGPNKSITQNKEAEKETTTPTTISGPEEAIAVSVGSEHACALTGAGSVWCWGSNNYRQLGAGDRPDRSGAPAMVKGLADVADVEVDYNISCARTKDGKVFCWGSNLYGMLGTSASYESAMPQQILGMPPIRRLGLEHSHVCALSNEGEVYCWGSNEYNRLGRKGVRNSKTPLKVEELKDITDIAVGMDHNCALRKDETVVCWGSRLEGRLGDGVISEYHTPVEVPGLKNVVKLCSGEYGWKTCAVRVNGAQDCWGNSKPMGPERENDVAACSGDDVLLGDGHVELENGSRVSGLDQVTRFSTEHSNGCAMRKDGTVLCWRSGEAAKVVLREAKAIAYSGRAACAVKTDGTLWCWGEVARRSPNAAKPVQAFGVSDVADISMGREERFPSGCVLHTDGTVACWYWDLAIMEDNHLQLRKKAKAGVNHAVAVDGGAEDGCAVLADGRVQCWGSNGRGELGDGTAEKRKTPVFVQNISDAIGVLVSTGHRCALHREGTVSCWGDNSKWDVGISFEKSTWKPVQVQGLPWKK